MGNTRALFATTTTVITAAITIVACGSDKAKTPDAPVVLIDAPIDTPAVDAAPDAPTFDFSCMGNSAPSVNANVTVSGAVEEIGFSGGSPTIAPLAGADVNLCKGNCTGGGNNLGSGTTDGSGNFSIGPVATSGTAIDGYARVTHTGDRTVLGFPAAPVAMDVTQPIITFQSALIDTYGAAFGCAQTADKGMVALLVTDCMSNPISDSANLTVSVQQGGSDVGDTPINAGQLSSMAAGFWMICNVPAGTATTVSAKYMNTTLLAHDVVVTAGTTTETIVRPGY